MIKHLKNLLSPLMMALVFMAPQMIQAMDVEEQTEEAVDLFPNSNLTSDVGRYILEIAVEDSCYEFGCAGNIGSVCTAWNNFFNGNRYTSPLSQNLKVNLQTKYLDEMFFNGELIYRPDPNSDDGMILLKISDLANPLEGTFDLSRCGDAGKYLSISTGYRKGKIAENANKVEIWFAPRAIIKQELQEGRAQQFKDIFHAWKPNAQVGMFWTWANDDNLNWFDYMAAHHSYLPSKNLYANWCDRAHGGGMWRWGVRQRPRTVGACKKFHVHFK